MHTTTTHHTRTTHHTPRTMRHTPHASSLVVSTQRHSDTREQTKHGHAEGGVFFLHEAVNDEVGARPHQRALQGHVIEAHRNQWNTTVPIFYDIYMEEYT